MVGEGFLDRVKDAVGKKYGAIGEAFRRLHDSFLLVDAEKSDFEKFLENRLSRAKQEADAEKTADKRREEAAEHLKAFDETLAEKVTSGERIGAEDWPPRWSFQPRTSFHMLKSTSPLFYGGVKLQ